MSGLQVYIPYSAKHCQMDRRFVKFSCQYFLISHGQGARNSRKPVQDCKNLKFRENCKIVTKYCNPVKTAVI